MPTVNIPPRIRFALYLIGAVALLVMSYAVDKHWAGDPEVRLVTGLAALLQLLAAAKTDLSQPPLDEIANDAAREQLDDDYQGRHEGDPAAALRDRNRREGRS